MVEKVTDSWYGKVLAGLVVVLLTVAVGMLHDLRAELKDLRGEIRCELEKKLDKAVFHAYLDTLFEKKLKEGR